MGGDGVVAINRAARFHAFAQMTSEQLAAGDNWFNGILRVVVRAELIYPQLFGDAALANDIIAIRDEILRRGPARDLIVLISAGDAIRSGISIHASSAQCAHGALVACLDALRDERLFFFPGHEAACTGLSFESLPRPRL